MRFRYVSHLGIGQKLMLTYVNPATFYTYLRIPIAFKPSLLENANSTSISCVGCVHTKLYIWDRSALLVVPASTSKLCTYCVLAQIYLILTKLISTTPTVFILF